MDFPVWSADKGSGFYSENGAQCKNALLDQRVHFISGRLNASGPPTDAERRTPFHMRRHGRRRVNRVAVRRDVGRSSMALVRPIPLARTIGGYG